MVNCCEHEVPVRVIRKLADESFRCRGLISNSNLDRDPSPDHHPNPHSNPAPKPTPIRIANPNPDESLRYEGLYDVASYSYEPTVEANSHGQNPMVYVFALERRAGQAALSSERSVGFGGDRGGKAESDGVRAPLTDGEREYAAWKAAFQREKLLDAKRKGETSRRWTSAEYRQAYEEHTGQKVHKRLKGPVKREDA